MSRFIKKNNKYELAFGHDHVLGLFVQVFSRTKGTEPLEDRDHISPEDIVHTALRFGFRINDEDIKRVFSKTNPENHEVDITDSQDEEEII